MVKLLGLLMALSACTTIGFYKVSEIKRRRILLVDFKELLIHISTEMSYLRSASADLLKDWLVKHPIIKSVPFCLENAFRLTASKI